MFCIGKPVPSFPEHAKGFGGGGKHSSSSTSSMAATARATNRPTYQSSSAPKIELIIHLKTAKVLGIAVPSPIDWLADEVIE